MNDIKDPARHQLRRHSHHHHHRHLITARVERCPVEIIAKRNPNVIHLTESIIICWISSLEATQTLTKESYMLSMMIHLK